MCPAQLTCWSSPILFLLTQYPQCIFFFFVYPGQYSVSLSLPVKWIHVIPREAAPSQHDSWTVLLAEGSGTPVVCAWSSPIITITYVLRVPWCTLIIKYTHVHTYAYTMSYVHRTNSGQAWASPESMRYRKRLYMYVCGVIVSVRKVNVMRTYSDNASAPNLLILNCWLSIFFMIPSLCAIFFQRIQFSVWSSLPERILQTWQDLYYCYSWFVLHPG